MSLLGQTRRFEPLPSTSGLPQTTDIIRPARLVWFVPKGDIAGAPRPSPVTPGVRCLTVKLHVEPVPTWGAGLPEGTALGIALKQKALLARKFFSFQDSAIFQKHAGTRCDIAACFDDAIITQ